MRKLVIVALTVLALTMAAVPAFANPNGSIVPMSRPNDQKAVWVTELRPGWVEMTGENGSILPW